MRLMVIICGLRLLADIDIHMSFILFYFYFKFLFIHVCLVYGYVHMSANGHRSQEEGVGSPVVELL